MTLNGGTQVSVYVNDVQEDLIKNVENVVGGLGNDSLGGDDFANHFRGGDGTDSLRTREGNDILDGGAGADLLNGGPDNDTYFVDNAADVILDSFGTDNVNVSVSYVLAAGVAIEALRTTNAAGTTAINLAGNNLANIIIGNAGNNIINGGSGADNMQRRRRQRFVRRRQCGRQGHRYRRHRQRQRLVSYALTAGVAIETLRTANAAGTTAINLTGNEFANIVTGNAGANILNAGAGNDTLTAASATTS